MIVVPYAGDFPADTVGKLESLDVDYDLHEIDAANDWGYCLLLDKLWRKAARRHDDLIVVEHDILIGDDTLDRFARCDRGWCAAPYWIANQYRTALGCTRFRAHLIRSNPDLILEAAKLPSGGMPEGHWKRMDVRIRQRLEQDGWRECDRHPRVTHLHRYPQMAPEA